MTHSAFDLLNAHFGFGFDLVFPKTDHCPAQAVQLIVDFFVSLHVVPYLVSPIVIFQFAFKVFPVVTVPKMTVDKNGDLLGRKRDIRLSRHFLKVNPVAKPVI